MQRPRWTCRISTPAGFNHLEPAVDAGETCPRIMASVGKDGASEGDDPDLGSTEFSFFFCPFSLFSGLYWSELRLASSGPLRAVVEGSIARCPREVECFQCGPCRYGRLRVMSAAKRYLVTNMAEMDHLLSLWDSQALVTILIRKAK